MTLIEKARDLAYHFEKEEGRPGAAVIIHALVAEIERLENLVTRRYSPLPSHQSPTEAR